jgi:hypothetical protein
MLETWRSTVLRDRNSVPAMSGLLAPPVEWGISRHRNRDVSGHQHVAVADRAPGPRLRLRPPSGLETQRLGPASTNRISA